MDNFKKRIESVFEKLEKELENIISEEALIEPVAHKTEETFADITVDTNDVEVKTVSRNLSLKSDENHHRGEYLDSPEKCELNIILSDGDNLCEDSVSNRSKSDDALYELDGSVFFPHQIDGSTSSETSESSFVVLERESSTVQEEFEFDDFKEESKLGLDEFDTANNNMAVQDSVRKKRSTAVSKHSYNNENPVHSGNSVPKIEEQDKIFSLCLEEGLKKLKHNFENFLEELENRSLKQNKLNLEESKMSPKSGRSDKKNSVIQRRGNTSNFTLSTPNTLENNFIISVDKMTSPEKCLTRDSKSVHVQSLNPEAFVCECRNGRYLHSKSNSTSVEWDLDTCEIKENGNCSFKVCKPVATECSSFKSYALSSGKFDVYEKNKNEEYCREKRDTKSRLNTSKAAPNQPFKKWVLSSARSNVVEKKKNEEYYWKNNKKSKLASINTNAERNLSVKSDIAPSKMLDVTENKRNMMQCHKRSKNLKLAKIYDKNNEIGKKGIYFTDKRLTGKDVYIVNLWEHVLIIIFMLITIYLIIFS